MGPALCIRNLACVCISTNRAELGGGLVPKASGRRCRPRGVRAARHAFASVVLSGNSIYRFKEIMGPIPVQVTKHYAHLTNQLTDAKLARSDATTAWRERPPA